MIFFQKSNLKQTITKGMYMEVQTNFLPAFNARYRVSSSLPCRFSNRAHVRPLSESELIKEIPCEKQFMLVTGEMKHIQYHFGSIFSTTLEAYLRPLWKNDSFIVNTIQNSKRKGFGSSTLLLADQLDYTAAYAFDKERPQYLYFDIPFTTWIHDLEEF